MKTIKLRYLFMILVMCFGALSVSAQSDIPLLGPSRATKPLSAKERRNVDKTITQTNTNRDGVATNLASITAAEDSFTTDELVVLGPVTLTGTSAGHATSTYYDMINSEWTPTGAMTAAGTNGIYSIINPIFNFSNAYGLRARVDLRDAAAGVKFNQIHAVDALINLSEEDYSVDDNISVIGATIHSVGITAGDVDSTGTMNLFHGIWPSSMTENFTVETNAIKIISFASTHMDYGFNLETSSAMTAGIYLNNHASNSAATMTAGIKMKSAASKMVYGVDMSEAGITTAEILCQNAATIDNAETDSLKLTETIVAVVGDLYVTGDISSGGTTSDFAITDYQAPLLDYWAKTQELNKLPTFEGKDRTSLTTYISGVEEAAERNLRYIVELEARIRELEKQ